MPEKCDEMYAQVLISQLSDMNSLSIISVSYDIKFLWESTVFSILSPEGMLKSALMTNMGGFSRSVLKKNNMVLVKAQCFL